MNKRSLLCSAAFCLFAAGGAHAEDAPAQPAKWTDTLKFSGQIEAGVSGTTGDPSDGKNFGHLFDDKANSVLLNQILLTATRPIDPAAPGYDYGFKLQGLYGSDARYTRPVHEFSGTLNKDQNQINLVEANVQAHTPWLTEGGIDFKLGRFATPIGYETIDPSTNPFYSHSYIFNFGIPLEHTGLMATWHATPIVDYYAGVTTGVNGSLDHGLLHSQNGSTPGFILGAGLNLMGGDLTVLALTHFGAENANPAVATLGLPARTDVKDQNRYLSDIVTTWKFNDKLTLVNELNWIHDDVLNVGKAANAYGIAQYGIYALTDEISLVGRGEIFSDPQGVFVAQSGNNQDFLRAEMGLPSLSANTRGGGRTTYGEITFGVNYKPALGIDYPSALLIRPEVRYDASLNDTKPYNGSHRDGGQFTTALDFVLTF